MANFLKINLALLAIVYISSCQIEDDHGTIQSQHGELIGEYFPYSEIYFNEHKKEMYFLTYEYEQSYESVLILALNYETNEISILFKQDLTNSQIALISYEEENQRFLFLEYRYDDDKTFVNEFNVSTGNKKVIFSVTGQLPGVIANRDYLFFNYNYDSLFIIQSDFNGITKQFKNVNGEVVYAIPGTSWIIIRKFIDSRKYQIYDYKQEAIIFQGQTAEWSYQGKFYVHNGEIFYYSDYQGGIINFETDEIIYSLSTRDVLLDFNPISSKLVFLRDDVSQIYHPQLMVSDLKGEINNYQVIYGRYIAFSKILNDGNTIIYYVDGKFYKVSVK